MDGNDGNAKKQIIHCAYAVGQLFRCSYSISPGNLANVTVTTFAGRKDNLLVAALAEH